MVKVIRLGGLKSLIGMMKVAQKWWILIALVKPVKQNDTHGKL